MPCSAIAGNAELAWPRAATRWTSGYPTPAKSVTRSVAAARERLDTGPNERRKGIVSCIVRCSGTVNRLDPNCWYLGDAAGPFTESSCGVSLRLRSSSFAMRLWSLHPRYLDSRGLVALWREALLAQAVLGGRTSGYRYHPQLVRFRSHPRPLAAIAEYLCGVLTEAQRRNYHFADGAIGPARTSRRIAVTRGQMEHEWKHLLRKLRKRDPERYRRLRGLKRPTPHPLFRVVPGPVESWEKTARRGSHRP